MLKSMTGYGRAKENINGIDMLFEIRSVNSRFLECNVRMPRAYGYLEEPIKKYVQKHISRGKVDISVGIVPTEGDAVQIRLNKPLLDGYVKVLRSIKDEYELKDDVTLSLLSRYNDAFDVQKQDEDREWIASSVFAAADIALKEYDEMRSTEGKRLYDDLTERIHLITDAVERIEQRSPRTVTEYAERLKERINEMLDSVTVDEARLLTEVAIYADRISVTEEIVRLKSHIAQFDSMINEEKPTGRKLDFLLQEMNREINTIGSKANDLEIAKDVVDTKAELEKIREQIQNIE